MRFLKATTLFNGKENLPAGSVLVIDDAQRLKDIVHESQVEAGNIEHLEGILMPGFVNAHCHLELSHLKEQIAQHTGLPEFAKQVITRRNSFSKEQINEHMQDADRAMWQSGIVAVGDISNGSDSFQIKAQSPVMYHSFVELIGLNPANRDVIFDKGLALLQELKQHDLRGSLAPHAPYSTSTQLIKKIADFDAQQQLPLSIHNQESDEETKFFNNQPNGFHELFRFLGLDLSWYSAPGGTSLQAYAPELSNDAPSLLVHNTTTTADDLQIAQHKTIFWCFCPGANQYIENRLPDYSVFKNHSDKICLGTDSLASNHQLDVLTEANIILKHNAVFPAAELLRALTSNAAAALGLSDQFGTFIIGKNTGLNLIALKDPQLQFIKKIT